MQPVTGIYRQRRPETTALYRLVAENLDLFYEVYDERFLAQHGPLPAYAQHALEPICVFGFARIRCQSCGDEMLLPFSCQRVGLCPSCQQKRAEVLCKLFEQKVLPWSAGA